MNKVIATKLIRTSFSKADLVSIKPFKKGMINKTYDVKIKNPDKELVLRLYPNESWKAEKEEYIYNLLSKKTKVPVPLVYKTGKKPVAYSILSKIQGKELGDIYKKTEDKSLIKEAGRILSSINSINFKKYGWIVGKEISPKFSSWKEYFYYGLNHKLAKLKNIPKIPKELPSKILSYIHEKEDLLDIKSRPCLLHKDYHFSHIIAQEDKINGIIDFEWAISGHNELDLIKSDWWMCDLFPEVRKYFHDGYKEQGSISKKFESRKKIYELKIFTGLISLSYNLKDKYWFDYNLKKTKEILNI